ncbi:MAG: uroporphyrinogen-III C-methyltransferase, partial [Chloroflexi bacterium]|nr:uroporphyrinogen-III C-methyltransferase [Chloroflexota bacterium]
MGDVGIVYLVGAGPGDPELITVRGLRLLRQADVLVHDRLVDRRLVHMARPDAEVVNVGKARGSHTMSQEKISTLLVARASEGKRVVRLKGGDPYIFGRGGEEAEALAQAGIPFEVVPGVTSAIAAPSYAGMPLTHRSISSFVTVVSGTDDSATGKVSIPWERLASPQGTLVVLMAWEGLGRVTSSLMRAGLPKETPAALVRWGTEPYQRVVVGTVGDIRKRGVKEGLEPPVVLVVGEV